MKDKIYLNKRGKSMKKSLVSLAIVSIILGGCTATNQPINPPIDSSKKDFISEMAIHDAVRARNLEQVQFLIDQKSQLNIKDIYGYTPLHIAVRLQEYDITNILIQNGADVNTVDNYQDTPLLDSTRDNYTELSKLLLCNGATRDVVDQHKMSPLHNSSKNSNIFISEMLQAQSLDPYCKAKEVEPEIKEVVEPEVEIVVEPQLEDTTTNNQESPAFVGLYDALTQEFKDDFNLWNAELTKDDLIFRFNNPIALFQKSKSELKPGFTDILSDFFPRYLKIIEQYKDEIQEIRIEGHTSSEYNRAKTDEKRYELNKNLSQKRASVVRDYTVNEATNNSDIDQAWIENTVKPYGMAYDNLILNPNGTENIDASRRVDFKIVKKEQ
jgi:outer membrane protein OmpA-like peptidoglycan-associated protein